MGGAAGTVAATVCYPLDTIRRRMQMKGQMYSSQASRRCLARLHMQAGRQLWPLHLCQPLLLWLGKDTSTDLSPPPAPPAFPTCPALPCSACPPVPAVQRLCHHLAHRGRPRLLPRLGRQLHQGHPPECYSVRGLRGTQVGDGHHEGKDRHLSMSSWCASLRLPVRTTAVAAAAAAGGLPGRLASPFPVFPREQINCLHLQTLFPCSLFPLL